MFKTFGLNLRKKLKESDKIAWLNAGGCAVHGLILGRWVKDNYPDKTVNFVYLLHKDYDAKIFSKIEEGIVANCAHLVVEIDGVYYDSNGKHKVEPHFETVTVPHDFVEASVNFCYWNESFDRRNELETLVSIYGKKYAAGINKEFIPKEIKYTEYKNAYAW